MALSYKLGNGVRYQEISTASIYRGYFWKGHVAVFRQNVRQNVRRGYFRGYLLKRGGSYVGPVFVSSKSPQQPLSQEETRNREKRGVMEAIEIDCPPNFHEMGGRGGYYKRLPLERLKNNKKGGYQAK